MATLAPPRGPYIKIKLAQAPVKRAECRRVLMRNQKPGPAFGRWEPISTARFVVVCQTKLEACQLVWIVGGREYARPPHLVADESTHAEERYLEWMLEHHFQVEHLHGEVGPFDHNGVCRSRRQVLFQSCIRGWKPGIADILRESTIASDLVAPALRHRWEGT